MINPRRVATLLIAALVIIGLALWVSSKRHLERSIVEGQAVLPDLRPSLNSITEVRLIKGDGSRTTLKKQEATWAVAERGFTADTARVRKLLLDLAELKVLEEKTRDPANYSKLGVEDVTVSNASGARVELVGPQKTLSLVVGKQSGTKSSYVRVSAAPQSLLAAPQITLDTDPRHWLDRTVIELPQERVKEVAVTPASGPSYALSRANKDQADFAVSNVPKGRALSSSSAANPVAGSLTSLTLDDVRKPGATDGPAGTLSAAATTHTPVGATGKSDADAGKQDKSRVKAEDPAHAIFQTFDGLTLDVTGHKEGDRHFVSISAKSSAKEAEAEAQKLNARVAGWELEIPAYKYDAMFRPLEESLAKVEAPAKNEKKKAKKS